MNLEMQHKLRAFLNWLWLRPENALLGVFKSMVFSDVEFHSPSLDLSCGDGIFMFLSQGGELAPEFDYFQYTQAEKFHHSHFVDIFNAKSTDYDVPIVKPANIQIDYDTDWKEELLNKARKLNLYRNLVLHDNNQLPLPFETDYFATLYSNSIYWVENVAGLLKDLYRILKPGGQAVFEVMTPTMFASFERFAPFLDEKAEKILDRKRRETMPGLKEYKEWQTLIQDAGFSIVEVRNVYPHEILIDIWNVGLRPIAHLLIHMVKALNNQEKYEIKQEWVDIFFDLCAPLLDVPTTYSLENSPY